MINLWGTEYGIGIQHGTAYFRSGENFAWYQGGSHNDTAFNAGGGTVRMVIKNGDVGIGTADPKARLDVDGAITCAPGVSPTDRKPFPCQSWNSCAVSPTVAKFG